MKKLISQGAEAKIFLEDEIVKERFPKRYRIKEIDDKLRKFRTRREAKVLEKLSSIDFPAPRLIHQDDSGIIRMENIKGKLVKDILDKSDLIKLSRDIGKKVAMLHNKDIIHGDLTTSNMIYNKEVYLIDFGLSFFSIKHEDKAVDLHLLKEALESKHYRIWNVCFDEILEVYKKDAKDGSLVLKRLEAVEKRGRYRAKKGS